MGYLWRIVFLSFFFSFLGNSRADEPRQLVLAHYMPWYATSEVSGKWGWHWTMDHFDPEHVLWDGKREAASHDYPLIGLYDSGDDHALECQTLLMKFAGIDGVIIDWYGTSDYLDHAATHRNVLKLIPWLKKAGLKFALCYEDKSLGERVRDKSLTPEAAQNQALRDLQWAQKECFQDPAYIRDNGQPILLLFGPQYLQEESWRSIQSALPSHPKTYALPHLREKSRAPGAFAWPPVANGKTLSPEQWHQDLETLYAVSKTQSTPLIATAFPGFKDIYAQAGVHDSYGMIAPRLGSTFTESLDLAFKSNASIIQVATWNDYGEGTVIEPTRNHGYRYLELLQKEQQKRGRQPVAGVADLRLPVVLYQLRQRVRSDTALRQTLDHAAELLFQQKHLEAEALLASVNHQLSKAPAVFADSPQSPDDQYRLVSEVIYREGSDISAKMHQRCRLDLYFPVNKQPFSTVVWFHGGGLNSGERAIPIALRKRGVAVVSVNYRLSPEIKSPTFIEDAAAALAWTFKNIANYGGSPERVFVAGHSAGAYLSLMMGLDERWLAPHGLNPNRIAGLIPLSPQVITHFTIREERGIPEKTPVVDDLAPLFHVRKDIPPTLLVTGDREKELVGRYEEVAYFWRMLKLLGVRDLNFLELQGYDHGGMAEPALPLLLKFVEAHERKK